MKNLLFATRKARNPAFKRDSTPSPRSKRGRGERGLLQPRTPCNRPCRRLPRGGGLRQGLGGCLGQQPDVLQTRGVMSSLPSTFVFLKTSKERNLKRWHRRKTKRKMSLHSPGHRCSRARPLSMLRGSPHLVPLLEIPGAGGQVPQMKARGSRSGAES